MSRPEKLTILISALLTAANAHAGESPTDAQMRELAAHSGCLACHGIEAPRPGPDGLAPIAPAWRDVAQHYRGQPGAAAQLAATVQQGSNAYNAHWKGKVSGLAMPPNAVAISASDTRRLVDWILALK